MPRRSAPTNIRTVSNAFHPTIERAGAVDPGMRTRPSSMTPSAALSGIWALLLIVFVVAALYFGRSVLVPIALATLITFFFRG